MANFVDNLKIVLGLETKGVGVVQGQLRGFINGTRSELAGLKAGVAGFFSVSAFQSLARGAMEMANEIKMISRQTGLSATEAQKLQIAFGKVGLDVMDATRAFDVLADKRQEALEKGGDAAKLFRAFGIGEDELKSLETGRDIFDKIAQKVKDVNDPKTRQAFIDIFGTRRGSILVGAAKAYEDSKTGTSRQIISESDVEALAQAGKDMKIAANNMKVGVAPYLAWLAKSLNDYAERREKSTEEAELKGGQGGSQDRAKMIRDQATKILNDPSFSKEDKAIAQEAFNAAKDNPWAGGRWGSAGDGVTSMSIAEALKWQTTFANIRNRGRGKEFNKPLAPEPAVDVRLPLTGPEKTGWEAATSVDRANRKAALDEAVRRAFMRTATPEQKKSSLRDEIDRLKKEAEDLDKKEQFEESTKRRTRAVELQGDLDELNTKRDKFEIKADQLAAAGGFIGGAALIGGGNFDPSLVLQQSQYATLQQINAGIATLTNEVRMTNRTNTQREV